MRTIMIVDTERSLQDRIARYLSTEDIMVLKASTNRDAISLLENIKDEGVDLILINREIPGTTIKALFPVKPGEKSQDPKAAFLFKPFTKEQLLSFLHDQL